MKYTVTESGIQFHDESEAPAAQPISRDEVMAIIRKISAGIEALDDCDCLKMGLRPCGVCGIPPIRREQHESGDEARQNADLASGT